MPCRVCWIFPAGPVFLCASSSKRLSHLQKGVRITLWDLRMEVAMTNEQKQQIIKLRQDGYGYATIASSLGLTKNQVSAFCRRSNLTGTKAAVHTEEKPDPNCCRNCGKSLTQTPGRKPVKFCSDTCRTHWWNTHLDNVNRKAFYSFTCACCGKPFTAYGNDHRKYCSHDCYIADRFQGGDRHD